MPKKKKTRKQKVQADVRRQTEPTISTHAPTISIQQRVREDQSSAPTPTVSAPKRSDHRIETSEYQFLGKDLSKTLILTVAIIGVMLALKFGTGI